MKIVGIVGRPKTINSNSKIISCQESYRRALIKYNDVIPFMILPFKDIVYEDTRTKDEEELSEEEIKKLDYVLEMCDAVVMPGGNRIYKYDNYICKYMIEHDKPLFGICLGMQAMNIADNILNNGIFDKNRKNETTINHNQPGINYVHQVKIKKDSLLYDILKTDHIYVNSRHNYHISGVLNFKVSAVSEDNLIEAIEYPDKKFILGVQWHPENMIKYDNLQKKILDRFIESIDK